ncbi:DUF938 domain-containing protein [Croceicoccus hydrothermalis]|uniref:DUF938 domain-containing protein n=1 Tax=Croceicoccus hydrothermalis TaxID=2867964 RepID=UPI001EFAE1CC|nr:DUF938 domain-containing protein [Croceicoccus hydrothermalis]
MSNAGHEGTVGPQPFVFGGEARGDAPATHRNRDGIAAVLRDVLPAGGTVLEIASGTGQHAAYFASLFPELVWQPSDTDRQALSSIAAWGEASASHNLRPPVRLDASADEWPVARADGILCINMAHISPWSATQGLFTGAARLLPEGGPLVIYGPFVRSGVETAASNLAFDENLKARDPRWGLRRVEALDALAQENGLSAAEPVPMPANNLMLIYRR